MRQIPDTTEGLQMLHEDMAKRLCQLGHPTRLCIYRKLVNVGEKGIPVGDLQKKVDVPASTLSHHISKLINVGLIEQTREGATLYCRPITKTLDELIEYLRAECCIGPCNLKDQ